MNLGMESEILEFKKSTSELDKAIISMVAMLNKHGKGIVYFGVKPNGDVIGQSNIVESTLRDISRKVSENIKPQIIPTISLELMNDKSVIKVVVKGDNIPYSAFNKFYMRSFDEDKIIEVAQIKKKINAGTEPDLIVKEPVLKDNLTFNLLKTQFSIHGYTINDKQFEKNTNLLTFDGRYNYMAELLADENDVSLQVVTFKGTTKESMISRENHGFKSLVIAVAEVIRHLRALNTTKVKLGGYERIEESFFDMDCFKEAWLNAVVHNRWIDKAYPAVYIFDDRIEIISYGGLPKSLSEEDFFNGVSVPVNRELLDIFLKLNIIEQTGHGVPLIINKYGKKAFDISENRIIVTIPLNKEPLVKFDDKENQYDDLNAKELELYIAIKNNVNITTQEIVEKINISVPYVPILIKSLKQKGYIERVGSNKTGSWKILK